MESLAHIVSHYGYGAIFLLLALGIVGLPVPDEWLLGFAGYLVARGSLRLSLTAASAFLGSCCGITVSYVLGRTVGLYLVAKRLPLIRITEEEVERAHRWFKHAGRWSLTFGYFIPGVRHLTAVVAGGARLEPKTFGLFAYSGALIWSLCFIGLGYRFGKNWQSVLEKVHRHILSGFLALLVLLVIYLYTRRRRQPPAGRA